MPEMRTAYRYVISGPAEGGDWWATPAEEVPSHDEIRIEPIEVTTAADPGRVWANPVSGERAATITEAESNSRVSDERAMQWESFIEEYNRSSQRPRSEPTPSLSRPDFPADAPEVDVLREGFFWRKGWSTARIGAKAGGKPVVAELAGRVIEVRVDGAVIKKLVLNEGTSSNKKRCKLIDEYVQAVWEIDGAN